MAIFSWLDIVVSTAEQVSPFHQGSPPAGRETAIQLLRGLPDEIDLVSAGALTDEERYALGAYSVRTPTIALHTRDTTLVHPALLALCLCTSENADDRDITIKLALHYVVAQSSHSPTFAHGFSAPLPFPLFV